MRLPLENASPSALKLQHSVVFFDGTNGIIHQASSDREYATGDFARDQEAVALDLLLYRPDIARRTLISLAQKQGTTYDAPGTYPLTEIAPGRIHHERRSPDEPNYLRSLFSSEEDYSSFITHCKQKSQRLIDQWGEIYFGAVDPTPKYLILAREYLRVTGDYSLLDESYKGNDGKERTMRESFLMAADWIHTNATYGPNVNPHDGQHHEKLDRPLLRFKRLNGLGIENQIMMDSAESFIFPDGTRANHDYPIADTGVQGQAYDALLFGAQLLQEHDISQNAQQKAKTWEQTAQQIQKNTLNLWMHDVQYFAMGEDVSGRIPTICANVVELLSSSIFDNLPEAEKQTYVSGIIRTVFSPDFLTEVGIRTRALRHIDALVVDVDGQPTRFSDYHGVDAVWMEKLQWLIKGLSQNGFHSLADQMRFTFLDAVNIEGSLTEFFWVTPEGKPIYQHKQRIGEPGILNPTSLSEKNQAWTISATIDIKSELGNPNRPTTEPGSWQENLETEILASMRERGLDRMAPMKTRRQVEEAQETYRRGLHYTINPSLGDKAQKALHRKWEEQKVQRAAA